MAKKHGIPHSGRKEYASKVISAKEISRAFPTYTYHTTKTNRYWTSPEGKQYSRRAMERKFSGYQSKKHAYFTYNYDAEDYMAFHKEMKKKTLKQLKEMYQNAKYADGSDEQVEITSFEVDEAYAITKISIRFKDFLIALIYAKEHTHPQFSYQLIEDIRNLLEDAYDEQTVLFLSEGH